MFSQQRYQGPNAAATMQKRRRTVKDIIPTSFFGLLGTFQLFLWIVIIVLEIMSIYYDAGRGTIYAGLWCSIVFFVTWVSMFCYCKLHLNKYLYKYITTFFFLYNQYVVANQEDVDVI